MYEEVKNVDPEMYDLLNKEFEYQKNTLRLIASENYTSKAVMAANGSVFTNKYAEGYPGKRFYAGNKYVDMSENLAIERAKKLFKVEHANVQPHSGSQANAAVYLALLKPGEAFMGLDLPQGGHLTHGSKVNFSGILYHSFPYMVDRQTEMLDYDRIEQLARENQPKMIICGYTAYPRIIDFKRFREIADDVGAYMMADISHIAGLIAGEAHPSPAPYADVITTTTHKTLRGPRGAIIMSKEEHAKKIDKAVFPGMQGGPLEHVIAAKAVAFHEAMKPEFKEYAKQIVKNAKKLAEELASSGFRIVSGGTDNHLMLVDVTPLGLTGKEAQESLEEAGIILNKNTIPYDTKSPFVASGIRIGTPSLTTRGMKESEMVYVAELITRVLKNPTDANIKQKVKEEVKALCDKFPIY